MGALRDNLTIAAYVYPRSETFNSKLVMLQVSVTGEGAEGRGREGRGAEGKGREGRGGV